jgi:hypothetical protein
MGNTELRRIYGIDSDNIYFASSDGFLYRQMKHKPRDRQLSREGCTLQKYGDVWLNKIKGYPDTKGYLRVDIGKSKTYAIHRLIASAFIENPNNFPQINHIDGVKNNNSIENLEWVSAKDNINHAFNILKRKPSYGKTGKFGERNNEKIDRNNKIQKDIVELNISYSQIAKKHGVTLGIVKDIAKNRKVQRLSKGRYSYAPSRVGGRAAEAQGIVRNCNEDIV